MSILSDISLTGEQREALTQVLGYIMSACSEACYHAGWLDGTQDELPVVAERVLTTQQPQPWGHGLIDFPTALTLKSLSLLLGHWATFGTAANHDHFVAYQCQLHRNRFFTTPKAPTKKSDKC